MQRVSVMTIDLTDSIMLSAGYFAADAFSPNRKEGLFNGKLLHHESVDL